MSALDKPVIIGRSSSHFTRIARLFAVELGVDHSFQVVRDLLSTNPEDYGGNPALRIPVLKTAQGAWFGALNVSRELWRQSNPRLRVVWPEDLDTPLLANLQELTLQAMATEVTLVMEKLAGAGEGTTHARKLRESLLNMMSWLEENASAALAALPPERDLSYLEVALFCLVTHLEFRDVLPTASYAALNRFCQQFAQRPSASATQFRFDV
ncbi:MULTISPECIES: glutathione S-transferase N-terminal domain-containing protein [unclassified Corallococcus]|uniref:glutathione S-transferase N-terminal domain-containing protein n=1 Tax=unclassified Corallococcus TaxID=2685029 RepID=UPI001A8DA750|nr:MULTISPECIES: glutathione S-transferase N-terminal domain-containing protein [unclassified Corallococcus]MBN9682629.1 glutathione S-transferase domain-containing protein [Corallococcus sp. NCSPR001]WAS85826.1 glutathione S-transferase domain-containing protein [Corallococcus sp. NCRR]